MKSFSWNRAKMSSTDSQSEPVTSNRFELWKDSSEVVMRDCSKEGRAVQTERSLESRNGDYNR